MTIVARITGRYERTVARARARSEPVDHAFRALEQYLEAFGGRLAAAIAYYGFFATFALGLLAYSALGFLLEYDVDLRATVDEFLQENLPVVEVRQISAGSGTAGLFGLVALVIAGTAWVEALRSSQRRVWGLEQAPGNLFLRRGLDVLALIGLALLVAVSMGVASLIEYLFGWVPLHSLLAWVLTLAIGLLLAVALMAALPRLRISPRRLLPPALAVAFGHFLLNTLGRIFIDRVQDNPAYAVVAAAAGLLVYLYLFHQVLLAGVAWAATSRHGRVVDLTATSSAAPDE